MSYLEEGLPLPVLRTTVSAKGGRPPTELRPAVAVIAGSKVEKAYWPSPDLEKSPVLDK